MLSAFPMWNGMKIQQEYKKSSNSITRILMKYMRKKEYIYDL